MGEVEEVWGTGGKHGRSWRKYGRPTLKVTPGFWFLFPLCFPVSMRVRTLFTTQCCHHEWDK